MAITGNVVTIAGIIAAADVIRVWLGVKYVISISCWHSFDFYRTYNNGLCAAFEKKEIEC